MKNGEKQVYPLQNQNGTILQLGLTKREYFAGLAMQGLLANPNTGKVVDGQRCIDLISVSRSSIFIADELLKQLENETTK